MPRRTAESALQKWSKGHLSTVGNTAKALVKFGYTDHPKVKRKFNWLLRNQSKTSRRTSATDGEFVGRPRNFVNLTLNH